MTLKFLQSARESLYYSFMLTSDYMYTYLNLNLNIQQKLKSTTRHFVEEYTFFTQLNISF